MELPLSACITTIADIYDALRQKRVYKPATVAKQHNNELARVYPKKGLA